MKFEILYHKDVVRDDMPKLDETLKKRIKKAIQCTG